ncbi:D-alanine-D-alanine ligase [Austwickia chelonae]|uniref:D-alanine--D-alanine ligase n=1 Tax=Austwickia chelonae NBRC 105200 TaxID=1184607 RepID=K6W470_9MICO|nr:D-alanine--D-alanine ligase family protein [Austwickia chelonae]GAB76597.1 D-alanine--D-alanine ligase [Austwickia chelonae NBRC 105200]SEW27670.1 D-alanine-D-alanine ligase [Austwickia chelonae]
MSTQQSHKPRIALVFGGRSSEHSVSCVTAASVLAAIDKDRYEVVPIGITEEGRWVLQDGDLHELTFSGQELPKVSQRSVEVVPPRSSDDRSWMLLEPGKAPVELGEIDVVFPLLHGPFGEDGTVQGMLELVDIRYVGSGVLASALMMDKQFMKMAFIEAGLDVGPYVVITDKEWRRDPDGALARCEKLAYPLFVKPCRGGSSMGVVRVAGPEELRAAVEVAREHDPKVMIEEGILGREIECGVLEGRAGRPDRASELGEIAVEHGHDLYDFDAKYLHAEDVRLSCPAELPVEDADRMRAEALIAFAAAGCEGLARVDFFYTSDRRIVINEINTMPGFTSTSMYPQVWAETGVSYPELISELVELARERRIGLR